MQVHGFTCGVSDLIMNQEANQKRASFIEQAHKKAVEHQAKHLGLKGQALTDTVSLNNRPLYTADEKL